MYPIDDKDRQILQYIKDHISYYKYAPSYREIAKETELGLATIKTRLDGLKTLGIIRVTHDRSWRGIVIEKEDW